MGKKLVITVGLPGSGKSTWAKEKQTREPGKYKLVSRDDIRRMLDNGMFNKPGKKTHKHEELVTKVQTDVITDCLAEGYSVIVHDTNLNEGVQKRFEELAKANNAGFVVQSFIEVSLDDCIEQDLKRFDSVGEAVIRRMHDKYLKPKPEVYAPFAELPRAVLVDLDGTLALFDGIRGPYESEKCEMDVMCPVVSGIVRDYLLSDPNRFVILMSGRQDKDRAATERWLKANDFKYDFLFMRETNDTRKDSIVKRELFDRHVRENYAVEFILDDRDQVVSEWRSMGIKCLQVAEGNF